MTTPSKVDWMQATHAELDAGIDRLSNRMIQLAVCAGFGTGLLVGVLLAVLLG